MSQAGWYPDPGGQPGMFRYWDGRAWSPTLSPTPYGPQPLLNQPPLAVRSGDAPYAPGQVEAPQRRPFGAWAIIALVIVALIAGGGALLTSGVLNPFTPTQSAPSNPTDFCPKRRVGDPTPTAVQRAQPAGRVQGGQLSYPLLGAPWAPPAYEDRVPFGRDALEQNVLLHENYNGRNSWVASVLVGELVAGDGFFSPQQGSEIVSKCIMGAFYSDAVLTREDRVNRATTLDGHDAWLLEMHLGFNIAGLDETGETAIILIVATGEASSSLYYASIPDSRPDLLATARQVQQQLRVEG